MVAMTPVTELLIVGNGLSLMMTGPRWPAPSLPFPATTLQVSVPTWAVLPPR
eukprot:CAMPEP_0177413462 /NCGR_PEP_ID=MMETSP0368-20130122/66527_1 /TAXON_ID=447022 ORGANISM="Scrippsiella hangoei-like, Strain SHHI-4" /NCGR_SAMPLE_ID=MMETSP0368 /ASSEMBLY_ACC=CAM_ASM_000363 /LENGTH=51 /DNA_ID=CAMNT_0018882773 /DNA_START=14 /DNA_END=165 /DNA_ORIENTATION=-